MLTYAYLYTCVHLWDLNPLAAIWAHLQKFAYKWIMKSKLYQIL